MDDETLKLYGYINISSYRAKAVKECPKATQGLPGGRMHK